MFLRVSVKISAFHHTPGWTKKSRCVATKAITEGGSWCPLGQSSKFFMARLTKDLVLARFDEPFEGGVKMCLNQMIYAWTVTGYPIDLRHPVAHVPRSHAASQVGSHETLRRTNQNYCKLCGQTFNSVCCAVEHVKSCIQAEVSEIPLIHCNMCQHDTAAEWVYDFQGQNEIWGTECHECFDMTIHSSKWLSVGPVSNPPSRTSSPIPDCSNPVLCDEPIVLEDDSDVSVSL